MTIPIPTIDDFDTSTVMTTIREVVDYLIGMVPQINNGDITDLQTTYTNNTLTITLVKGDGTTISKNVTIQASGGESPYPTDVALSLSGTVLNCDITLSNNTHVTGSQDLATFATYTDVEGIQSDLQEQITGLKLSTSNNNMTLNGDSVQIVKSVSGTVSDGNLKITVNGVQSGDIPLPNPSLDNIPSIKIVKNTNRLTIFAQPHEINFACKLGNLFDIPRAGDSVRAYNHLNPNVTIIESPVSNIYYGYRNNIFKFNSDEFTLFNLYEYQIIDFNIRNPSLNVNLVGIQYENKDGEQFNRTVNIEDGRYSIVVRYIETYDTTGVIMTNLSFLENEDFTIEFEVINSEYVLPGSIEIPKNMVTCVSSTINMNTDYLFSVGLNVDDATLKKLE